MAREGRSDDSYTRPVRRILVGLLAMVLLALFLLWRIDGPRVERLRAEVLDRVVPGLDGLMEPLTALGGIVDNFQSYMRIYEQNRELRRELQQMKAWREAALQLERKDARLLDLDNVRLDPQLTHVTGVVMADSGSPFRKSVLINVGRRDGIRDGWATMDGLGLVGRVSGAGETTARVILLTDPNSRVPVVVQPSGQNAIVACDNSRLPRIEFLEAPENVRPGDRIVTTGDGGVFPAGLLVGQLAEGRDGQPRVRLSADYGRLEFLRVLRSRPRERIEDTGGLIAPEHSGLPEAMPLVQERAQ